MNLIRDPWVPVLRLDGRRAVVGLSELFAQCDQLRDIDVRPLERVALMRLLICIAQAALEGPSDRHDWPTCIPALTAKAIGYLDAWEAHFELFGDGPRFLQVPDLEAAKASDEGSTATKLDVTLASGNNSTLFDNQADDMRAVTPARSALNLLTFQCFAPGGRIGVASWNGKATAGDGSSRHAPCTPSSMVHTLIIGHSLLETIHRNLLTREIVSDVYPGGWGRPVWELPVERATDNAAVANATSTYLGRLVPLSRAIRLLDDASSVILANGIEYPIFPAFREATATITSRKDELALLSASPGRSLWRQLGAVAVVRRSSADGTSGPLALRNGPAAGRTTLWVGALITNKAKIIDVVESSYAVPSSLFEDFGRIAYEAGIDHAMQREGALMQAVKTYASTLKVDAPAYDRARRDYWTFCEQHLTSLFDLAAHPELTVDMLASAWGEVVRAATLKTFENCCPAQSPRQIEAHARALPKLFLAAKKTTPTPAAHV